MITRECRRDQPLILLMLSLGITACGPLDNPWDPRSCVTGCTGVCYWGYCVTQTERPLVTIQPGQFTMGSRQKACPAPASCGELSETSTEHKVTLTHRFELQATEVTLGQFVALMGYAPLVPSSCVEDDCRPGGSDVALSDLEHPVSRLSWHEAAAYCNAASRGKGLPACYSCDPSGPRVRCQTDEAWRIRQTTIYDCPGFRLPTEAEWEYAARSGRSFLVEPEGCDFEAFVEPFAWYSKNSADLGSRESREHRVATREASPWGLYDMNGNLAEWVHDEWSNGSVVDAIDPTIPPSGALEAHHVVRGGSHGSCARGVTSVSREDGTDSYQTTLGGGAEYRRDGFRCARSLQ
jgi:formylglycine-generating enzyme required for sulfatase activity